MKTIKVIDLLNKIANGEHNFSFKYGEDEFFYDFDSKHFVDTRFKEAFGERYSLDMMLNDEVEAIEDKKIEYVGRTYDLTDFHKNYPEVAEMLRDLADKTIKIIDFINEGRNE